MKPQSILSAANAFREALRKDVVSDAEISRRSNICTQCPAKTPSGVVAPVLASIINKHKVDKKISAFKCGICKCPLILLVPAKEPHVDSVEERAKRIKKNKNCWLLNL